MASAALLLLKFSCKKAVNSFNPACNGLRRNPVGFFASPSQFVLGGNRQSLPSSSSSSSSLRFKPANTKKKSAASLAVSPPKPSKNAWSTVGFSTAESYDLFSLENVLRDQDLYQIVSLDEDLNDVCIFAEAKYNPDGKSAREIFFFADGSVIFWNVSELERGTVLAFLDNSAGVELNKHKQEESEQMQFQMVPESSSASSSHLDKKGRIQLMQTDNLKLHRLEKFAFSNAMAASVKLGALEATLDRIIDSIEFLSEDMKDGRPVVMSRHEVLMKSGEIFALRHMLNLSSDLLDTPDFYWDRDQLEAMYLSTCAHLTIGKRIRVANEKINHCAELLDLVTNHLKDIHHTRLEWFIIILILIEVIFELLHLVERFLM